MNRFQPLRKLVGNNRGKHGGNSLVESGDPQSSLRENATVPYDNVLFPYDSLDPTIPGYFRLVRLESGWSCNDTSLPRCTLINAVWSSKDTKYEALSYVWGDTTTRRTISLNGNAFVVTTNLYSALMHLRYDHSPRMLWVDAICIDQNNVEEKNHQVGSMGQIYANCSQVIVWLGEKDGESDATLEFINLMSGEISRSWHFMPGIWAIWDHPLNTSLLANLFNSSTASQWMAVCRLLQRPWWRRAWIFQEFVRAPDAKFYVGKTSLNWETIYYMIKIMYSAPDMKALLRTEIVDPAGTLTDANDMIYARLQNSRRRLLKASMAVDTSKTPLTIAAVKSFQVPNKQAEFSFFTYLLQCRHSRYSKGAHDKITSILNMADTGVTCALSPKVRKSAQWKSNLAPITLTATLPEAVSAVQPRHAQLPTERAEFSYFAYLLHCQRSRGCGDPRDKVYSILNMADAEVASALIPNYSQTVRWTYILAVKVHIKVYLNLDILCYSMHWTTASDYPSWCPDWEKSQNRSVLGSSVQSVRYDACSRRKAHAKFSRDDSVLALKGVCIDTVRDASVQSSTQGFSWRSTPGGLKASWDLGIMAARVKAAKNALNLYRHHELEAGEELETSDTNSKVLYENLIHALVAGYYTTNSSSTFDPPSLVQDHLTKEWWPDDRPEFCRQVYQRTWGRTVVLTQHMHLGLAPQGTREGDEVWILYGCSTSVVLRRDERGGELRIWVGDAYIHGAMQGEAVEDMEGGYFGEEMVLIR